MKWTGETDKFKNLISFVEDRGFNFSELKSIHLSFTKLYQGYCSYPTKRKDYKITCGIQNTNYPRQFKHFICPEFKKNHPNLNGGTLVVTKEDLVIMNDVQEDMAWLLGHELFHFLRKTKQVPGRNTQAQANEFGFKFVREFQEWKAGQKQGWEQGRMSMREVTPGI